MYHALICYQSSSDIKSELIGVEETLLGIEETISAESHHKAKPSPWWFLFFGVGTVFGEIIKKKKYSDALDLFYCYWPHQLNTSCVAWLGHTTETVYTFCIQKLGTRCIATTDVYQIFTKYIYIYNILANFCFVAIHFVYKIKGTMAAKLCYTKVCWNVGYI